jgi:hypothetical protein
VFSNAPRHYVEEVLEILGVGRFFDAVYTIESTRYRPKPALHGFRMLLRAHDLERTAARWSTTWRRICALRKGSACRRSGSARAPRACPMSTCA